ncbi:unnamed protein product [Phytophthora fragariaefolia]|uniref:Unnamed protein product n=1 Tax=Phytophthora fragariaefolia TaxID=1490495 RepID=A0A9W6WZP1_9STRA|nr:unnamed protein product [Phytophthora fragariaefolia]
MNIGRSAEGVVSQLRSDDSHLGTGATELGVGSGQLRPIRGELGAGRDELGVQDNCKVPSIRLTYILLRTGNNCGVYVLLAFEIFGGASPLGYVNKQTLQCLRYRYLRLCPQA